MLSITPIASGSRGNCILIRSDQATVLVDIGIPLFYVEGALEKLSVRPCDVDAVFITHEHTDHINGVQAFAAKYATPVYMHGAAAEGAARKLKKVPPHKIAEFGDNDFFFKDMTVSPFNVSHDVHCTGYSFLCGGEKVSMLTDAGAVEDSSLKRIADSDVVLIEANHDVDMLKSSKKYPAMLKRRILSPFGHLSNADSGAAVTKLALGGVCRQFILAHLSMENNYPELAFAAVKGALKAQNIECGKDIFLSVAEQYKIGAPVTAGCVTDTAEAEWSVKNVKNLVKQNAL